MLMCHKPAQIENMARINKDKIYITTIKGADLLKKKQKIISVI